MMMGFDGYSFCKPHSASYTLVAYKSAYLRAHYPAEFMAAVISNGGGYYSTFGYLSEARRMGLKILPPDINQSEIKYTGKEREIRVGLMQLKELSREGLEFIIHDRTKNGPYASLEDFLGRTGGHIHLQDVRILIKAGCFDSMAGRDARPALMWQALKFFDASSAALHISEPQLPFSPPPSPPRPFQTRPPPSRGWGSPLQPPSLSPLPREGRGTSHPSPSTPPLPGTYPPQTRRGDPGPSPIHPPP